MAPAYDAHAVGVRPPWPAVAAALVAVAALWVTSERLPGLVILGVLFALPQLVPVRLPRSSVLSWVIRLSAFGVIVAVMGIPESDVWRWYTKPEYTNLFGTLCTAELALRAWERRRTLSVMGDVIVLSAFVLTCAAVTYDRGHMAVLVPVYVTLTAIALHRFRPAGAVERGATQTWAQAFPRGAALAVALLLGFGTAHLIQRHGDRFFSWTLSLITDRVHRRPVLSSTVGLTTSASLTSINNPAPSMQRVLRIDGPLTDGHLRGLVFDTYQDGRWGPDMDRRRFEVIEPARLAAESAPDASSDAPPGRRLRVTRFLHEPPLLLAPLSAASVVPMRESHTEWDAGGGRTVRAVSEAAEQYVYDVVLPMKPEHQGPLAEPMHVELRQRYLAVPEDVRRQLGPILEQVSDSPDPRRRIMAVVALLQANHDYSLRMQLTPGVDPVLDFVLNGKDAHCQYFASATVILLRGAGVPARYVTGFYAHEKFGRDTTVVRGRDAHAWAEAWVDGVGWVTVEATPASGRPDEAMPPAPVSTRMWERVKDAWDALTAWLRTNWQQTIVLAVAGGVLWLVVRWLRIKPAPRSAWDGAYEPAGAELVALERRFNRVLRRAGAPCPRERTWEEHLGILAREQLPPSLLPTPGAERSDAPDPDRTGAARESGSSLRSEPGVRSKWRPRRALDVSTCHRFVTLYNAARFGRAARDELDRIRDLLKECTA